MTTTATLPALDAAVLCPASAWHPVRLSPAAGGGLDLSGLAGMWWLPLVPALGGELADGGAAPDHDYLTDSAGVLLTDSDGVPLWAPPAPAHDYLTDSAGTVLSDSAGDPLWSA